MNLFKHMLIRKTVKQGVCNTLYLICHLVYSIYIVSFYIKNIIQLYKNKSSVVSDCVEYIQKINSAQLFKYTVV